MTLPSLKSIAGLVRRIHRSEQGAEGLEKLLIIALIVLPLLGLLIVFRTYISQWVSDRWNTVQSEDTSSEIAQPTAPTGG